MYSLLDSRQNLQVGVVVQSVVQVQVGEGEGREGDGLGGNLDNRLLCQDEFVRQAGEQAAEELCGHVDPDIAQIAAEDDCRPQKACRVKEAARDLSNCADGHTNRGTCEVRSNPGP